MSIRFTYNGERNKTSRWTETYQLSHIYDRLFAATSGGERKLSRPFRRRQQPLPKRQQQNSRLLSDEVFSLACNRMVTLTLKINLFGHGILENQIQALSRTLRHRFKEFQGPCLFSRTFQALKICKKIQGLLRTGKSPEDITCGP